MLGDRLPGKTKPKQGALRNTKQDNTRTKLNLLYNWPGVGKGGDKTGSDKGRRVKVAGVKGGAKTDWEKRVGEIQVVWR